ncbi:hypothetical protein CQ12_21480 [Bradyrhizobium jicamae]|uniref:NrS-1 polymerase-like helicase domain-containing protein n=1 Tax=Bradyrhizobium jicamae TaxID=280332 RepID=A0A0R3LSF1_9BRAD|nr:primase-helicase family protein [Bradyrhizobium jicamae]KRR10842.1 hypothetical protein CQ12_21480 [Bradyrhizobium jicamae]
MSEIEIKIHPDSADFLRLVAKNDAAAELDAQRLFILNEISVENIDEMVKLVNNNGKPRVMRWGKSGFDPKVRVPEFMTIPDFKALLQNRAVYKDLPATKSKPARTVRVDLAKHWLEDPTRYIYDGLVFDSKRNSKDEINLWRGFGITPAPGDWSKMEEHIAKILAAGEAPSEKYLLHWLAFAFQNPTERAEVAVALMSEAKGTGKGMLGRAIVKAFGAHGLQILQRSQLTGKFNAHHALCGFLFSDEAVRPDRVEDDNVLKGIITEDTIQIERKGIDLVTMRNALKVMLASNNSKIVQASEDERRYAVFEVSTKRQQDQKYFRAIQEQLDDGGLAGMMYDLQNRPLGEWHPRSGIPATKALKAQQVLSLGAKESWLYGYLLSGVLDCQSRAAPNIVKSGEFFDLARKRPKMGHNGDPTLSTFLEDWGCERKRSNGSHWVFPPLSEMRTAWLKAKPFCPPFANPEAEWSSGMDIDDDDDEFG